MQVWAVPAILHWVFFKWLVTIGPISYFFAGILFTLAFQAYLLLMLLHVPEVRNMHTRRWFTSDEDIKEKMLAGKAMSQGGEKSQDHSILEIKIEDID
jgi:hypothetical protein